MWKRMQLPWREKDEAQAERVERMSFSLILQDLLLSFLLWWQKTTVNRVSICLFRNACVLITRRRNASFGSFNQRESLSFSRIRKQMRERKEAVTGIMMHVSWHRSKSWKQRKLSPSLFALRVHCLLMSSLLVQFSISSIIMLDVENVFTVTRKRKLIFCLLRVLHWESSLASPFRVLIRSWIEGAFDLNEKVWCVSKQVSFVILIQSVFICSSIYSQHKKCDSNLWLNSEEFSGSKSFSPCVLCYFDFRSLL
jgi:hypothetical protein